MKFRITSYSHSILIIAILLPYLAACGSSGTQAPLPGANLPASNGSVPAAIQVFFTDPSAPSARYYEGGPDEYLAEAIDAARYNVDVAVYSLNLWSIRDALIHASQRGVAVRMIMESDNMNDTEIQELLDAGIPILSDRHEGLMHDKFAVIDRDEVWTGSMNYTVGSAYRDNNNLLQVRSVKLAEAYTHEFDQMFESDRFGPDRGASAPPAALMVDDIRLETYFSPENGVAGRILDLIHAAAHSVQFMAYSFTSDDIGAAVIERSQAGVRVSGVMDASQSLSNSGTEYDKFIRAGVDVRRSGGDGLMHHKVIIIDDQIVITGSYNFSLSAETVNDENVIILVDPGLALKYLQEFQKVYDQAQP